MTNLVKIALFGLLACSLAPQSAQATLIQGAWFFEGNDNADVSSLSQTVTAANGNITFDFEVSITSSTGAFVRDTSAGTGISSTSGGGLAVGEVLTFTASVSNIVQNGPHRINLQDLSFRFLGAESANGSGSEGTLILPANPTPPPIGTAGSTSWRDANNGPSAVLFNGSLPGTTGFGGNGTLANPAEGFFVRRESPPPPTIGTVTTFNGQSGWDIPRANVTAGGASGTNILSFSHRTDLGSYRLNDIVVQIRATPEPSSLLLGLVAAVIGMFKFGWRRTLQLVGIRKESDLVTT